MSDTAAVTCRVLEVQPQQLGKLIALAAVEIVIDGIPLVIHGVQVARTRAGEREATLVTLPNYRGADGRWKAAITLPDELREPIADVVLAQCLDMGLLREQPASPSAVAS